MLDQAPLVRDVYYHSNHILPVSRVMQPLNPKVTMIINQCFPLIVERQERDPVSPEQSIGSLERYRKMGYDAIRHLPEEERERDQREIDSAFQESVNRIHQIERVMMKGDPDPSGQGDQS